MLRRWEDAGGVWRVAMVGARGATVVLCRCDGGEEVDRFTSGDPRLLAMLVEGGTAGGGSGVE